MSRRSAPSVLPHCFSCESPGREKPGSQDRRCLTPTDSHIDQFCPRQAVFREEGESDDALRRSHLLLAKENNPTSRIPRAASSATLNTDFPLRAKRAAQSMKERSARAQRAAERGVEDAARGMRPATRGAPAPGLQRQNPQMLEKDLAADQYEHNAAHDGRALLVARAESVPHGNADHGEHKRRHADDHHRPNDVHA